MKKKRSTGSYNIVFVPPRESAEAAIGISRQLKTMGGLFVLGSKRNVPHITIYMADFPIRNISKVKKKLKMLCRDITSEHLIASGYRQSAGGYVDVSYRRSKRIKGIQKKVIYALNPLRQNIVREKELQKMLNSTPLQKKNILQYGYRSVGQSYTPHLTFTRVRNPQRKVRLATPPQKFSFTASKIGLFYLGQHGTCRKEVMKFNLQ